MRQAPRALEAGETSPIPAPSDLDIAIDYTYAGGSAILPNALALIRDLRAATSSFKESVNDVKGQGRGKLADERIRQFTELANFRNRVSDLRTTAQRSRVEQKEFLRAMQRMQQMLVSSGQDLRAATQLRPELRPVLSTVYNQLVAKHDGLSRANELMESTHEEELKTQDSAIGFAETLLDQLQKGLSRGLSVDRLLRDILMRAGDRSEFDAGLQALDETLEIEVDIEDIRRAAERNTGG